MPELINLFAAPPTQAATESFDALVESKHVRIERIVSTGQASPAGFWCDQPADEWVAVLKGRARVGFENGATCELGPGDFLYIPARQRHRVDWTDPDESTIWLAVHIKAGV